MADPQVGVYSTFPLLAHDHSNVAGGGQLDPEVALNPYPKTDFGDGSDGDVVVDGAVLALARDMNYNNLSAINVSVIIPNGFKVKVRNKLFIQAGSTLWGKGGSIHAGQPGAAGVGGAGDGITGYTGARLPTHFRPTPGAAGADAPAPAAAGTSNGGVAPAVNVTDPNILQRLDIWAGGGGGGGGAVGTAPAAGGTPLPVFYGAKGGNGGNAQWIAGNHQKAGGGGGAGGGLLEVWAKEFDNSGIVTVAGTAGGAGEGDANAQAGGGGGGGGGAFLLWYRTLSGGGLGTIDVSGGAGGTSFGGAANGKAGANGLFFAMPI